MALILESNSRDPKGKVPNHPLSSITHSPLPKYKTDRLGTDQATRHTGRFLLIPSEPPSEQFRITAEDVEQASLPDAKWESRSGFKKGFEPKSVATKPITTKSVSTKSIATKPVARRVTLDSPHPARFKRHIGDEVLHTIRTNYHKLYAKKPKEASDYLKTAARDLDCSIKTLHNKLKLEVRRKRSVSSDVEKRRAEQDRYANVVWDYIRDHSYDENKLSISLAYDVLVNLGKIPLHISEKHIYKSIKRQNFKALSQGTWKSWQRDHAMSLWQVDFSKSEYFKPKGHDIFLREPNFTKKQQDGRSLYLGVAIDDASRVMYVEYFLASGENMETVHRFLFEAFRQKEGKRLLQGLPKSVYVDRSSTWMSGASQRGLAKLGVDRIIGADQKDIKGRTIRSSNKQARGKVERAIRTLKEVMEPLFFHKYGCGTHFTISSLNAAVRQWVEEWNSKQHPNRPETKWEIYTNVLEGLEFPPDHALAEFTSSQLRKVIRRRIRVATNTYAEAPDFVPDGIEVEILSDKDEYFLLHGDVRYKLDIDHWAGTPDVVLEARKAEKLERKRRAAQGYERDRGPRVQLPTDVIKGIELRGRVSDKVQRTCALTLGSIPDDIWPEFKDKFNEPMSVKDADKLALDILHRLGYDERGLRRH